MSAMTMIIFGATGAVGGRLVDEALRRGHQVSAVVRSEAKLSRLPPRAAGRVLDARDGDAVRAAIADHELVLSALRPPEGCEAELPALTLSVLEAAAAVDKRVLIVGGAANLLLPDDSGHTVLSAPGFLPAAYRPIAAASYAQFRRCAEHPHTQAVYFSPPTTLSPGPRTGRYRRGSDTLLIDAAGESRISMEDFAVAMLDEAEHPTPRLRRVTVAY